MPRIIAIDYGSKRTGLATTDNLQIIATALDTVASHEVIKYLIHYAQNEEIEAFVVGMPTNLQNEKTDATDLVKTFVKQLQKAFPDTKINLIDERFTSKIALQAMIMAGTSKKYRQQKSNIDKVSAVVILQDFLSSRDVV